LVEFNPCRNKMVALNLTEIKVVEMQGLRSIHAVRMS